MQRSKEITLDDSIYFTSQYSASKGLKLLTRLAKIAGKPIAILSISGMDTTVTPDLIGQAVDSIVEQLNEVEIERLVKDILETTQIKDQTGAIRAIQFDIDFSGRYGHLFRLLKEVLLFQYDDFLPGLAAVKDQLTASKETTVSRIKAK